ncbi:hypothetical protein [Streptomyces sp. SID3343]|uniref:hypothetical protein n=1 Tax=Streptomyces sp. SID3343 TaxID=2690260 RepID=UPI00136D8079|nr:hypothetical protein [Streptomyces sp. SID3343]MYW03796.1 hypothetical protein [Streptomyces sp. SID3343]
MVRLTDAQTGTSETVSTSIGRRVRIAYPHRSLRAAILADTLRRVAERHRLTVTVHQLPYRAQVADPAGYGRYNMPAPTTGAPDAAIDVYLGESGDEGPRARVHVLHPPALVEPGRRRVVPHPEDPLVLRLIMLSLGMDEPLRTGEQGYRGEAQAARMLAELRELTAICAESPSAALPAARVGPIHEALDDNLDTRAALGLLLALARDPSIAPGARFEALVHVDRFLALDLAKDVGRPRD